MTENVEILPLLSDGSNTAVKLHVLDGVNEAIKLHVFRRPDSNYECSECGFTSNRASVVHVHVEAKHLQTSGFECPICQKHCPTRNSLNIHRYRYHRSVQWNSLLTCRSGCCYQQDGGRVAGWDFSMSQVWLSFQCEAAVKMSHWGETSRDWGFHLPCLSQALSHQKLPEHPPLSIPPDINSLFLE